MLTNTAQSRTSYSTSPTPAFLRHSLKPCFARPAHWRMFSRTAPTSTSRTTATRIDQSDYSYTLKILISQRADDAMEQQRAVPIYDGSAREANERGEAEKFNASRQADNDCRDAVENAIARNYDGSRLNTKAAIAEVREQFGEKRMVRVTASLIANRTFEGRISPENRAWADKKTVSKEIGSGHTHPGLLDIFAARLREGERKRERGAER